MTTEQDPRDYQASDQAVLLLRRMMALGLDLGRWSRLEPATIAELQRVCSACAERRRCASDLAVHSGDPTWTGWQDYCPNAGKLALLSASNPIDWAATVAKR